MKSVDIFGGWWEDGCMKKCLLSFAVLAVVLPVVFLMAGCGETSKPSKPLDAELYMQFNSTEKNLKVTYSGTVTTFEKPVGGCIFYGVHEGMLYVSVIYPANFAPEGDRFLEGWSRITSGSPQHGVFPAPFVIEKI
jgi:hypothetical protein